MHNLRLNQFPRLIAACVAAILLLLPPPGACHVLGRAFSDILSATPGHTYTTGAWERSREIRHSPDPQGERSGSEGVNWHPHGNVRFLTDTTGQITDTFDYDAFGQLIARTGITPTNHLYCGEEIDPDLGLSYNRARYLNRGSGRFWGMDAHEGNGADPESLHKYLYGGGDPARAIDPSGHSPLMEQLQVLRIGVENIALRSAPSVFRAAVFTTEALTGVSAFTPGFIGGVATLKLLPYVSQAIAKGGRAFARYLPGVASGVAQLKPVAGTWLKGTAGNAGFVPKEVGELLEGRSFKDFDEFREAFWKAVSTVSELANQFSPGNVTRMSQGLAPKAVKGQAIGEFTSYALHHDTPIQHGGGVYDLSNIIVVTPRYHQEILMPSYYY